MRKNMGKADRITRTVIAVVLLGLAGAGQITGAWAIVAAVVAVAFLVTSTVSFCPAYWPFGVSTRGRGEGPAH